MWQPADDGCKVDDGFVYIFTYRKAHIMLVSGIVSSVALWPLTFTSSTISHTYRLSSYVSYINVMWTVYVVLDISLSLSISLDPLAHFSMLPPSCLPMGCADFDLPGMKFLLVVKVYISSIFTIHWVFLPFFWLMQWFYYFYLVRSQDWRRRGLRMTPSGNVWLRSSLAVLLSRYWSIRIVMIHGLGHTCMYSIPP